MTDWLTPFGPPCGNRHSDCGNYLASYGIVSVLVRGCAKFREIGRMCLQAPRSGLSLPDLARLEGLPNLVVLEARDIGLGQHQLVRRSEPQREKIVASHRALNGMQRREVLAFV